MADDSSRQQETALPGYAAPMEGITGYLWRRVHHDFFGDWTSRYYTPFVVSTHTRSLKTREIQDVLPENNEGVPTVPQVLANKPEEFLSTAERLSSLGWREINLNLGCPVAMVANKGKGSGFLRDPEGLERFFEQVLPGCEKLGVRLGIKTRLGFSDAGEAERLFALYAKYPFSEVIVHARTREQMYGGQPDLEAFAAATGCLPAGMQVCYNGNLFTAGDAREILSRLPKAPDAWMCGRGLLANPALTRELQGGPVLTPAELSAYHARLYEEYRRVSSDTRHGTPGDRVLLSRMKEHWAFLGAVFPGQEKLVKAVLKSGTRMEYEAAVRILFGHVREVGRTDAGIRA